MNDDTRKAVAEAILDRGSPRYTVPDGPMLDLLTEIAKRGDPAAFSEACLAYATAHPGSRRVLEDKAPGKLLNSYLHLQPGVEQSSLPRVVGADPEWAERIRGALWSPPRLRAVLDDLLEQARAFSSSPPSAQGG